MLIQYERAGEFTIIRADGRIDTNTAKTFETEVTALLTARAQFVVDLAGVNYVSSAGLRSVLLVAKQAEELGCKLRFAALTPDVEQVFTITGFDRLLSVFATTTEAMDVVD